MILVCPGGWTDDTRHAPATIGTKAPESDARVTHGCCDDCARAMDATITCRWCEAAETEDGLCTRCEVALMVQVGRPTLRLTVYRQAGAVSCAYDGAGAVLRLREAMRAPEYRAFALEKIPAEVAG